MQPSGGNRGGQGRLPTSDTEALSLINARLPEGVEPLTADSVYIHYLEAANDSFIGDRYLFLAESTLKNIATCALEGFAFMNSHRTGYRAELPLGATFCGRFERVTSGTDDTDNQTEDEAESRRRAVVGIYMLRGVAPNGASGPTTDDLSRMIDARTVFDCSVGLYGGWYKCDVCGHDLWACDEEGYWLCPHSPGSFYRMDAEQIEAQKARGVPDGRASATLEEGLCNEVSVVYDGAVTGAGFLKAAALIANPKLERGSSPGVFKGLSLLDQQTLAASLSAGYGQPCNVSTLESLAKDPAGNPKEGEKLSPDEGTPPSPTNPDADTGTKDKPMKLSLKALRVALGLGDNDPLEIEQDGAPTPAPAPAPAPAPDLTALFAAALAPINAQLTALGEQNKTLTEAFAASQKNNEEAQKAQALATAQARVDAAVKRFLVTPSAAQDLKALAQSHPDAFAAAMQAFEKNGPVLAVSGIPGVTQDAPGALLGTGDAGQIAQSLQSLAQKKVTESGGTLPYHEAVLAVIKENPALGDSYELARTGGN